MRSLLTFSVIVPTWKRPGKLKQCLESLASQTRLPNQLIIVLRREDAEGVEVAEIFCKKNSFAEMVFVHKAGVIAAENAGLRVVVGDYVAFIDDDGYAPNSWLEQIEFFFINHPDAYALGGSDIIKSEPWSYYDFEKEKVGILTWYGRIIGNHHRKCIGGIRKVHVLKGVNMIFKRSSFEYLDERLAGIEGHLGNGSQWELDLSLTLLKKKLNIYFDPKLVVIHDSDHSKNDKLIGGQNNAHNLSYVMIKHLSFFKYLIFLIYALIVGNEQLPGLAKLVVELIGQKKIYPFKIYFRKLIGFFQGILTYVKGA